MKFLDKVNIKVQAGKGGDGVISFRKEFRVDKGGPDGGDGGRGGSVFFVGDTGLNTLFTLKFNKQIKGNDGENGRGKDQYGAAGKDIFIKVPLGTVVKDGDRVLADIVEAKEYLIAKGGKGGKGNVKFKTARNTVPRLSENGDPGDRFELELTLKVLADVGFVGKPSAGKSTLLSKISNAKPKIADYEFTTLTPQLGFVNLDNGSGSFVAADLPGLIKGAHAGRGLGIHFLKHIERCRAIAHIIDFGTEDKNPIEDYEVINDELKSYNMNLENRKQLVIANKMDSPIFEEKVAEFQKAFPEVQLVKISAIEEKGISELKYKLFELISSVDEIEFDNNETEVTIEMEEAIRVENPFTGHFEVLGAAVERVFNKIPLNSFDNERRFNKKMKSIGVWDRLKEAGIQEGDTVVIYGIELVWNEEEF